MGRCCCGRDAGLGQFQCPTCRLSNQLNDANKLLKKIQLSAETSAEAQKEVNEYFRRYEGKL